jgi:hypothetical protein
MMTNRYLIFCLLLGNIASLVASGEIALLEKRQEAIDALEKAIAMSDITKNDHYDSGFSDRFKCERDKVKQLLKERGILGSEEDVSLVFKSHDDYKLGKSLEQESSRKRNEVIKKAKRIEDFFGFLQRKLNKEEMKSFESIHKRMSAMCYINYPMGWCEKKLTDVLQNEQDLLSWIEEAKEEERKRALAVQYALIKTSELEIALRAEADELEKKESLEGAAAAAKS